MVKCLKLTTGEDLIGQVTFSGDTLKIKRAFQVAVVQAGPDQLGIGLMPFLPFAASDEFNIHLANVLIEFEPAVELANQYASITGGIVMAANRIIDPNAVAPSRPQILK
jgi:hypothetical protein